MRRTVVLVLFLLSVVPAARAAGLETTFSPPGEISGDLYVQGAQWLALFFQQGNGVFEAELSEPARAQNHTYTTVEGSLKPVGGQSAPLARPATDANFPTNLQFHYYEGESSGSLIIEAQSISLKGIHFPITQVQVQSPGSSFAAHVPAQVFHDNPYWDWTVNVDGPNVLGVTRDAGQQEFQIEAKGLQSLHWYGSTVRCKDPTCPDGGGRRNVERLDLGQGYMVNEYAYGSASLTGGTLRGAGNRATVLIGGSELDIDALGAVRLPLASSTNPCSNCPSVDEKTIEVRGEIRLENTRLTGDEQIRTELGGSFATARIDESPIAPSELLGGNLALGVAGTAGALALLKFLIAPFFTRLSKEQALEHPRRKQIFDYIQHNPGANFREIARNTGIAAGTVRHHLNVMTRSDIVVEHQHGSTVRLFENVSRFQATSNWADQVLLREPALGELFEWLKANPGSPQKAVLEGMEPQGWSRSTTQHRLARLVDGGLATIRLQGRLKLYAAVDRSAKPPPPAPPFGRPSANPA